MRSGRFTKADLVFPISDRKPIYRAKAAIIMPQKKHFLSKILVLNFVKWFAVLLLPNYVIIKKVNTL